MLFAAAASSFSFCCCGVLGSLLLRECLRGGDSFNSWFVRSTVVLLVCSSASSFFQIGIMRFYHGWRFLGASGTICAAKTLSYRFLLFVFRFGVIFLWAFVFRDRFPDRPYRFPRSLRSVSCFSCRSACIFGLDQVDRKLNVLHQSWRDSTLLRPQQGERAFDKPSVRWK